MAHALRKHYGWTAAALAALTFAIFHALAIAGGREAVPIDDLATLMGNPSDYGGREVAFHCRFALRGKLFKEINGSFNSREHVNFAAWPHLGRLWDDEDRGRLLPTLYVARKNPENLETIQRAAKYDLLLVKGKVAATYGGMPWISVTSLEKVDGAEETLADDAVEHIRQGNGLMAAGKPEEAAPRFEAALLAGVPAVHRPYVNSRISLCYRGAGRGRRALGPLRDLTAQMPGDPYPRLALAEGELAAGNLDAAIDAARLALEITPRFAPAQGLLGEAYGRKGLYGAGLEMLSLAAGAPGLPPAEQAMLDVRRARVLLLAGRRDEAVKSYALAMTGGAPLSGEAWLRRELAAVHEESFEASGDTGFLEEAVREYQNADRLSPGGDAFALVRAAEATYNLALARHPGAPDHAAVQGLLARAGALAPAYPPARVFAARLMHLQGEAERAAGILRDTLAECADDPTGLLALADTYEAIGRSAGAYDLYDRVLAIEPWNRHAARRLQRLETCLFRLPSGAGRPSAVMADNSGAVPGGGLPGGVSDWKTGPEPADSPLPPLDVDDAETAYMDAPVSTEPLPPASPPPPAGASAALPGNPNTWSMDF